MWSTVLLTDLTGEPLGEVTNPYDRRVSFRLRRMTTVNFRVRLDDPLADVLLEGRVLVKQYEDEALRFVGDVIAANEKGSDNDKRVEVSAASGFWRLGHRLCGKSPVGFVKTAPTDRGLIAKELIDATNAESDSGVRVGTIEPSASDACGPWHYKPVAEAITELASALDGFDWRDTPVEPNFDAAAYPNARPVTSEFEAFPIIGTLQRNAVFEYATGQHNVRDYDRAVSKEGLLNHGHSLPPGFPDTSSGVVETWADASSIAEWGLHEAVVPGDLADASMRLKLVQEHIRVRRLPRQVISFQPVREDATDVNVPRFKEDYDLGDVVTFRAVNPETDTVRVNGTFRVYGVDIAIDEQGAEQPTLHLVDEGE